MMNSAKYLLLILPAFAAAATAFAQSPGWSIDPSAYEYTMSVTARVVIDGVENADPGDSLAAFVDNELRGVAAPGSGGLYFLTVYANATSEEISFKVYDFNDDAVREASATATFEVNGTLGTPDEPFYIQIGEASLPPVSEWSVNAADFEFSMTVTGAVHEADGARLSDPGNQVVALVGTEVRGVADAYDFGGEQIFFLTIYANTSGEQVRFGVYDAHLNEVRPIQEVQTFIVQGTKGTPDNPSYWTVGATGGDDPGGDDPGGDDPGSGPHGLPAPQLVEPLDGAQAVPIAPTLKWSAISGAVSYDLEISDVATFDQSIVFTGILDSLYEEAPALSGLTTYFWRARGVDENGAPGSWSEPRSFTTVRGVGIEEAALPERITLGANHPNPFRTHTIIRYVLPHPANVKLAVFDLLGRRIAVIANGRQTTGRHTARFEPKGLPNGVYLYRLSAGDFTDTGKMVLAR